ncbi:hypothetical protein CC78DRAFT_217231 [Lojkania enalia]|uniref:DH domain-containing protein n=1 Tax=Lojkania enalia TaxID=147567 RepID=A0A9P4N0E6_9PLEO|nr:hypothetical protein CC78DRAFT_217231 [Didymosphaeria enalia]
MNGCMGMENVSAAIGIVAVLPQCLQTAKDCYDLRLRYREATDLVTAIYSESMVIAASLSQIQNLIQRDALDNKSELHQTIDQALTGAKLVYACLDAAIRELGEKANSSKLSFRDRTNYAWNEATFKDILQQIRGQQIALSLLVQGLQMESIWDIKQLMLDNSTVLDRIASRSRELRKAHPSVKVPYSIYDSESNPQNFSDAQSVLSSAEFAFDDEVVNSTAYRRAMARVNMRAGDMVTNIEVVEGNLIDLDTPKESKADERAVSQVAEDLKGVDLGIRTDVNLVETEKILNAPQPELPTEHSELLDSLELTLLPFMPPSQASRNAMSEKLQSESCKESDSVSEPFGSKTNAIKPELLQSSKHLDKEPPPLPPRQPSRPPSTSMIRVNNIKRSSGGDTASVSSVPSMTSKSTVDSLPPRSDLTAKALHLDEKIARRSMLSQHTLLDDLESLSFKPEDLDHKASLEDIKIHDVWASLLDDEKGYIDRLTKFRRAFYDPVIQKWPVLEKHLEAIAISSQFVPIHEEYLCNAMKSQISQKRFATCSPTIFEAWATQAHKLYRDYAQRVPHAENSIRLTQNLDHSFSPFVAAMGLNAIWLGKSWEDFFIMPLLQLDIYIRRLESLVKLSQRLDSPSATLDQKRLESALGIMKRLRKSFWNVMEGSQEREEIQSLNRRIHTSNLQYVPTLKLSESSRRIIYQGELAIKINGHGPWRPVHAVLLDNFFFWGNLKPPKSWKNIEGKLTVGGKMWLSEVPILTSELDINGLDKHEKWSRTTILDDVPRGIGLHHFSVGNKNSSFEPHILGAQTVEERQLWCNHLFAALATGPPTDSIELKA